MEGYDTLYFRISLDNFIVIKPLYFCDWKFKCLKYSYIIYMAFIESRLNFLFHHKPIKTTKGVSKNASLCITTYKGAQVQVYV